MHRLGVLVPGEHGLQWVTMAQLVWCISLWAASFQFFGASAWGVAFSKQCLGLWAASAVDAAEHDWIHPGVGLGFMVKAWRLPPADHGLDGRC